MDVSTPTPCWHGEEADSPVIAVAVHAGHLLRDEVADAIRIDPAARRREEDPGTDGWTELAPTRLVARRSRFEVDLNRPRSSAVYTDPADTWGLELWRRPPSEELIARSLQGYDAFYETLQGILDRAERAFGGFVVYDLHSYNHRRAGPDGPPADPAGHPDINLGTGSMDRDRWGTLAERFLADLRAAKVPYGDGQLDVRENVCFRGRQLAAFVHERYPRTGCALAVEVKKFYMDEHTGVIDAELHTAVGEALASTVPGVLEELRRAAG